MTKALRTSVNYHNLDDEHFYCFFVFVFSVIFVFAGLNPFGPVRPLQGHGMWDRG